MIVSILQPLKFSDRVFIKGNEPISIHAGTTPVLSRLSLQSEAKLTTDPSSAVLGHILQGIDIYSPSHEGLLIAVREICAHSS